jgi:UDP-N-acetylglucosamine/UDP-N-acetylgalactosamine diphosphorylase
VVRLDDDPEARGRGEEALTRGEVAVLIVAGGQGSRLGFDLPKGMFPIGPVSNKTLFHVHAEKVLALSRRHGRSVPFLVMTSPATHDATTAYFAEQRFFGLPREEVYFFQQGTMPALDLATGKLLMDAPDRLFTGPNGHGGTLTALAESGLLEMLRSRRVRQIFYFQVDNPLVRVADPSFLGLHLRAEADVSTKVVRKARPEDKLGNLVLVDGRCTIIEYSDLPKELAAQRDEHGRLRIWAGNTAIHIFGVDFLRRVTGDRASLPFHLAKKAVPHIDAAGNRVTPTEPNALKFEMFIFDVLPLARSWTAVETTHAEEFAPLKNATGADSEEAVRQAMSDLAAVWLEKVGAKVPRTPEGHAAVPLEISPTFALDAEELAAKLAAKAPKIEDALYLE